VLTRLGGVRLWPASSDHVADTLKHVVQVVGTRAKFAALRNSNIAVPIFLVSLGKGAAGAILPNDMTQEAFLGGDPYLGQWFKMMRIFLSADS